MYYVSLISLHGMKSQWRKTFAQVGKFSTTFEQIYTCIKYIHMIQVQEYRQLRLHVGQKTEKRKMSFKMFTVTNHEQKIVVHSEVFSQHIKLFGIVEA